MKSILREPKICLNARLSPISLSVSSLEDLGDFKCNSGWASWDLGTGISGRVPLTVEEEGCWPHLPPPLSSSWLLLLLLLLNNHTQLITLVRRYQHSNSSGNSNNAAYCCAFPKLQPFHHSACVYTHVTLYKMPWHLASCSYEEKQSH